MCSGDGSGAEVRTIGGGHVTERGNSLRELGNRPSETLHDYLLL